MDNFNLKKIVIGVVSALTISIAALFFLWRHFNIREGLAEILTGVSARWILLLFFILFAGWLADACRLRELAGAFGCRVPLKLALGAVLAGNFSINITPFFAGAGIVHVYLLNRRGLSLGNATAAVTGGAMVSHALQALLALAALSLTQGLGIIGSEVPAGKPLLLFILTYLGIILALGFVVCCLDEPHRFFLFLTRPKLLKPLLPKLYDFHRGLNVLLKRDPRRFLRICLFTSLYLISFYAVTPLLLIALGTPQPLGQIIAFQLVLFFAASLAPTPGSSGAIELGAFTLFSIIVPLETLGYFLVWWRIATFYIHLVVGPLPFAYLALNKKWYIRRMESNAKTACPSHL
jgi:glycosyltransferase 2 family protein